MTHSHTQTTQPGFPFLLLGLACVSQPNKPPKVTGTETERGQPPCLPSVSSLPFSLISETEAEKVLVPSACREGK